MKTFVFILLLGVVAYGVGSQSLIDPYRILSWEGVRSAFVGAFVLPYWQLYGELSLDQ